MKAAGSSALVGYAAVDGDAAFRNTVAQYMACGNDSVTVDLYGMSGLRERTWTALIDRLEQLRMVRKRKP